LLTVIGASASMAERSLANRGLSQLADLEEIQLAVARASELTKQLLAFASKQVLAKKSVDAGELVQGLEPLLRRALGDRVKLLIEIAKEPLGLYADPAQLEQVILQLFMYARDAVEQTGRIQIEAYRQQLLTSDQLGADRVLPGDYACIEVSHDGVGLSREAQTRLFEPFFSSKPRDKTAGIGLATSLGIVRQHEGTIRVETDPAGVQRTRLRVLLPLAAMRDVPMTSGVVEVPKVRPLVLVVEDEPQVRAIAARALNAAGFQVQQASNGALGLSLLQEGSRPVDVLVTDVMMPELSGPDLARAARRLFPNLGLVFMSGFPESMADTRSGEFPGAAFLAKPFSAQMLVDAVRERLPAEVRARERTK